MSSARPLVAAAAPLAVALGCGGQPAPDAAPGRDLTAGGAEAWYEFEGAASGPRTLLRGAALGPGDWHGAVRLGAEPTPAEQAAFDAGTVVTAEGALELRAPRGALVHVLPLDADADWLELSAAVDTDGLTGTLEDGYARLAVFQLDRADWPGSARALVPHVVAEHLGEPVLEATDGPVDRGLRLRRDPAARGLAIVVELVHDGSPAPASARFAALRLVAVGAAEAALELSEEVLEPAAGEGRPRLARWDVDLVHRRGWSLPAGARLVLPLDGALGGRRVDFHVAALGADRDATWTVRCLWSADGGAERELVAAPLALAGDGDPETAPAGWRRVTGTLPPAADDPGALVFAVEGDGRADPRRPTVPVVASVRIDPAHPAHPAPRDRPNLLILSLDTLRADHLGAYGGDPRLSEHFDALAARGALFRDAWSTAPYTLPAHVSLFSGQFPTVHGVERPSQRRDRLRTPLLAELLADAGYRTAAFTGGAMVLPRFGFADGFERYGVLDPALNDESAHQRKLVEGLPGVGARAFEATGVDAIAAQLDEFGQDPWLLFVHTYAAHEFDPPRRHLEAIGAADGLPADDPELRRYLATAQTPPPAILARIRELYAGGVRQADELTGRLLALLDARGDRARTVVVVLSDHGKELGDHGIIGHGHVLYDELVRIPLLFAGPGVPALASDAPAQITDVLPTLLALFDLPVPAGVQGRDLFAEPAPPAARALWAEVDATERLRALRTGPRKTIVDRGATPGAERFDLADDPREAHPLPVAASDRERLEAFEAQLRAIRAGLPSEGLVLSALDDADRAQLEALGYLVGPDGSFVER